MKIKKRSGKVVDFNSNKIKQAINNVFDEFEGIEENTLNELTMRVVYNVQQTYKQPSVENVQDTVENVLIEEGYIDQARAYIHYRDQQERKRNEWVKAELPLNIWKGKYQYKGETFEEFFDRVAGDNGAVRKLIKDKKFLPAGRILANRKLHEDGISVTYSNCYVTSPPNDSLESIIDKAKDLARTFSYGGGSGIDISKLRPSGAKVNNAAKTTSGPISFLNIYDTVSSTIGQKGRRAALMVSIDVNHPDVEEFIERKLDLEAVNKANMSVRLTDDFMRAAKNDEYYLLEFVVEDTNEVIQKEVKASKILNKLAYGNWYSGEPGALFWDRIESWNLLSEYESFEYAGTNPCGEEPLPAGGSCLLGAINLSNFVDNEFKKNAKFDYSGFIDTTKQAVIYLNEILDEGLELHPLKEQRESVKDWRQIGLGIMGLGDMFIKLGVKYGSEDAVEISKNIAKDMLNAALQQSAMLAKKDGSFPRFEKVSTLKSEFLQENATTLSIEMIKKYGLRNSQLLTVAPTGSISNICEVSGGIEPIYQVSYYRKTESLHEEEKEYKVFTPIINKLMDVKGIEDENNLPSYVVDAHQLDYKKRINIQSAFQQYIDASISSTVNLKNETTVEDIKELYIDAWEKGVKGITAFRNGCAREGILRGEEDIDGKTDMTDQDFIDAGICPKCKTDLDMSGGCKGCKECGFQLCGV